MLELLELDEELLDELDETGSLDEVLVELSTLDELSTTELLVDVLSELDELSGLDVLLVSAELELFTELSELDELSTGVLCCVLDELTELVLSLELAGLELSASSPHPVRVSASANAEIADKIFLFINDLTSCL